MKYQLQTIPIWQAYEAEPSCVLCRLADGLEEQYVRFHLGNSVMAPNTRVEVNEHGFCNRHLRLLLQGGNKHGFALMMQTHIERLQKMYLQRLHELAGDRRAGRSERKALSDLAESVRHQYDRCLICDKMERMLRNYAYTIVYLFRSGEEGFPQTFRDSSGFCLEHLPLVLETSADVLSGRELQSWIDALDAVEQVRFRGMHEQLGAFSDAFDYRTTGQLTPESREAPENAARLLGGRRSGDRSEE
jgi:hypothetical protein